MTPQKIVTNFIFAEQLEQFEYDKFNPESEEFNTEQIHSYKNESQKYKNEKVIKLINDKIREVVSHTDTMNVEIDGKLDEGVVQAFNERGFFVKTKTDIIVTEAEGFTNVTPKYDKTEKYVTIISWNPSDKYLIGVNENFT